MKQLLLAIIPLLMVATISNVYASGPRLDYDERSVDVPGAPECWVDGYDAGFAGVYDKDRANECNNIPGDQYNRSWPYGCKDRGLTEGECNDIKNDLDDDVNHESLQEQNRRDCYDDGYEDGLDHPYDHERGNACNEYGRAYHNGFINGCVTVKGNTEEICESATDR